MGHKFDLAFKVFKFQLKIYKFKLILNVETQIKAKIL